MDFLATLFLESPIWLAGFSFICLTICLFTRRKLEGPSRAYCLPATLGAILLLFTLQSLITTQREHIWVVLDSFIGAIEKSDASAAGSHISAQYDCEKMDHDAIVKFIGDALADVRIYDSQIARRDTTLHGDGAELLLGVRATVSLRGEVGQFHAGVWKIGWMREGDRWLITSIRPQMIDTIPVSGLRTLREIAR